MKRPACFSYKLSIAALHLIQYPWKDHPSDDISPASAGLFTPQPLKGDKGSGQKAKGSSAFAFGFKFPIAYSLLPIALNKKSHPF